MSARLRVAVTLEQCWHRVPGGTARPTLELARARSAPRDDVELVGVAARHSRRRRRLASRRSRSATCRCPGPPCTRPGTACGGRRCSGPPGRSTSSTPPGWPCRRRAAPLVVTVHDLAFLDDPTLSPATASGSSAGHRPGPPGRRPRDVPVARPPPTTASGPGSTPSGSGWCPGASTSAPASPEAVDECPPPVRPGPAVRPVRRHPRAPQEPRRPARGVRHAARSTSTWSSPVPSGWNEDLELGWPPPGHGRRPGATRSASCPTADLPRPLRRRRGRSATRACGGLRAAGARGDGAGRAGGHLGRAPPPRRSRATPPLVVDPLDDDAIAAALASVLDDPDLAADLRVRGRERAARYTWAASAEAAAAVYREAAG